MTGVRLNHHERWVSGNHKKKTLVPEYTKTVSSIAIHSQM